MILRKGFSLLELIVVIIIIGVLASLALPRFINFIYSVQAVEALTHIKAIRNAIHACEQEFSDLTVQVSHSWVGAIPATAHCYDLNTLPMGNPNNDSSGKFDYAIYGAAMGGILGGTSTPFSIVATTRNPAPLMGVSGGSMGFAYPGGSGSITIYMDSNLRCGGGIFKSISQPGCS